MSFSPAYFIKAFIFLIVLTLSLTQSSCKHKKPDEVLLVKNLLTRWENGILLNRPDSVAAVFSDQKDWILRSPEEMQKLVLNSEIKNIRVGGRGMRFYREEDKIQSAEVDLTLTGQKEIKPGSFEHWQGKLHLLLRKHKKDWGIVDYKFE